MDTDEIKQRLFALPTRKEFEEMLSSYVTEKVLNLQLDMIRQEIRELKERPNSSRTTITWVVGLLVSGVVIAGFLATHVGWK